MISILKREINKQFFSCYRQTLLGVRSETTSELQERILLQYRQRLDVLPIQQRLWTIEPSYGASVFTRASPFAARQKLLQQ